MTISYKLPERDRSARRAARIIQTGATCDDHSLETLLNRFCLFLAARNYSVDTIEQRTTTMTAFIAWAALLGVTDAQDVTPEALEAYRVHLFRHRKADGAPLALRTQVARLVAVRAFLRWLAREGITAADLSVRLELPRGEYRLPATILSPGEVETILALPNITKPLGLRDRAMMETLYVTGIRRSELVRLRLRDVDHARQLLLVRKGKGGRDRMVPTGERCLGWLLAYRQMARPKLAAGESSDRLFLSSRGTPMRAKKLTALVSAYVSAAKLGKNGSCHLFRHAAATHMLENGADIRFIQAMLGHESLDTTKLYTHVSIAPLAAVHAATHPAARVKEGDHGPPSVS